MKPSENTSNSRRDFLKKITAAAGGAAITPGLACSAYSKVSGDQTFEAPMAIASGFNGEPAVTKAVEVMQNGGDVLDGIIQGVNIQEADPDDMTVGYGGVPNEKGIVQLDAAVMDGRTHESGSVGALENIMHPSKVARLVMERTDHSLLVGEGALRFARMHGFKEEDLLTDRARERWLEWKETLSDEDNYFPTSDDNNPSSSLWKEFESHHGTIHSSGLDTNGGICATTTTSGLFYKMPGRVGDSPITGAGLFADANVGAAGSTGRGEANLQNLSSFLIVERMRMGDSPEEACLKACERIAENTKISRLLDDEGNPNFNVRFYALNRDGVVGGAELRSSGGTMTVGDPSGVHEVELAYLLE